jgi:hypothetical protein
VDAVGADDDIGLDRAAVREPRDRRLAVGVNRHAPLAEGHHVRRHGGGEHVEQVGPVHGRALDPLPRRLLPPARLADHPAGHPVPGDRPLGPPGDLPHAVLDADRAQHPHRVGVQRDAGPDLLELGRRLVHADLDPGPRQRDRRRQPADAAADDRHTCHAAIFPPNRRRLNRTRRRKSVVPVVAEVQAGGFQRPLARTHAWLRPTAHGLA